MSTLTASYYEFFNLVRLLRKHRDLTFEMTRREIADRYSGQLLGTFWAVGHPLVLMFVYVFVFGYVFKMKIGGTVDMPLDYTVYLMSGLIPWMAFQETLGKSAVVMRSHSNLVKQVVFPIEVLPIKGILATMISQGIATAILAVYTLVTHGGVPWTYLLLPVLWTMQFVTMAGAAFLLAAVGAYFRDTKDFVQILCLIGAYTLPIFYLPEWVPEIIRPLLYLNPLSYMAWCFQDVCYFGRIEHPWAWPIMFAGSWAVFLVGYGVFRRLKICFGSVL